ncbi:hypothetical protein BS78_K288800 [Paspalum vaginatum]|uniref:Uncharacterized protein n=1 Tax=Paspalum vaginatum TaxID=158149 RepID=A0A9W7XD04_9POAL|nr:hypothetical protein BS78_K288800 [Paspalum vaginatum]
MATSPPRSCLFASPRLSPAGLLRPARDTAVKRPPPPPRRPRHGRRVPDVVASSSSLPAPPPWPPLAPSRTRSVPPCAGSRFQGEGMRAEVVTCVDVAGSSICCLKERKQCEYVLAKFPCVVQGVEGSEYLLVQGLTAEMYLRRGRTCGAVVNV